MKTTLVIDDVMLKKASELTGVKENSSLVKMGLESLISRESSRKLAQLGKSETGLKYIRRRKMDR